MSSEPRLPIIYQDPNLRQDHFDRLSPQMRKLYLETYPESPRHQPAVPDDGPRVVRVEHNRRRTKKDFSRKLAR